MSSRRGGARRALLLLLAPLLTAACGGSDEPPPLDGTSWALVSLDDAPPLPEAPTTIEFDGEQVAGSSGCNRYSGAYAPEGGDTVVGPLASTRVACAEPVMAQELAYLEALQSATSAAVEDGALVIAHPGGTLTYEPA